MTVAELLNAAQKRLDAIGDMDARADAEWLMCACLNCSRSALGGMGEPSARRAALFESLLSRRESGEPLQYVLGDQPFMGHMFKTDARALIPRFETEEVCLKALELIKRIHRPRVLDIGTGTGALAISIALERPDALVCAVDISGEALSLARENAAALAARIEFLQGDLYAPVSGREFDLVISNPPYIKSADMDALQPEVKREPALALDGGADGLDFYRRLAAGAGAMLAPGGAIVFEVGAGQAQDVSALLLSAGLNEGGIFSDMNGVQRIVCARH